MDVIKLILSEEEAAKIPDDILVSLASCSGSIILDEIRNYLSSDDCNPDVKMKVANAYSSVIDVSDYLMSEDLKKKAKLVSGISYQDINPLVSEETLLLWKNTINEILSDERSKAYTAPVKGVVLKDILEDLKEYKDDYDISNFVRKLRKTADLFRDKPHAGYKGTVVKPIVQNTEKYQIIVRGIDYVLRVKREGKTLGSWRFL